MKKNLLLFGFAVFLLAGIIVGLKAINDKQTELNLVSEQILQIDLDKKITADLSANFVNTGEKYTNAEIEEDFYYGYEYHYINEDNIHFFSLSEDWDEDKLKEVETELYANVHGDEIRYVDAVIISGYTGGDAAGSHYSSIVTYDLPVSFYDLLPDELKYYAPYEKSTINLYGMSKDKKVKDYARVLSHEYGHHFTQYYFGLTFDELDSDTEYFKLRLEGMEDAVLFRESYDHYIDNHMWYLGEIAAEDYVVLMGSDNTKNVIKFFDHKVMWSNYKVNNMSFIDKYGYRIKDCSNGIPHENAELELPIYVDGLDDYFYSFVDEESPFSDSYDEIGSLNLSVEHLDYNQYKFTWDRPYKEANVTYSLIGYDAVDGSVKTIVRTLSGLQASEAWFGNFTYMQLNFYDDETIDYFQDIHLLWNCKKGAQMIFRVSVAFPDGIVLLSDPLTVTWE